MHDVRVVMRRGRVAQQGEACCLRPDCDRRRPHRRQVSARAARKEELLSCDGEVRERQLLALHFHKG